VTTAAPAAAGVGTTSGEGTATTLARSDHSHQSNTTPANIAATAAIGTSTEPARADHVHAYVFGQNYQTVVANTRTTNNTTAFTGGNKLTLTTGALTGTFLVEWTCILDHSATTSNAEARLYDNTAAAILGNTAIFRPTNAAERYMIGSHWIVTLAGTSKDLIIQFRIATAGTAGCDAARITFFRVA
jgi:hypothetical protein